VSTDVDLSVMADVAVGEEGHAGNDLEEPELDYGFIDQILEQWGPPETRASQPNLAEFLRLNFDLDENKLEAIARLIKKRLRTKDEDEELALAVAQSLGANGKCIIPQPDPKDPDGKHFLSSFSRTTSTCGPCNSSVGSHGSPKNGDSGKPKKRRRGIKYNCILCCEKKKYHICRLQVCEEGPFRGHDERLWRVRPLKVRSLEELKASALQRAIRLQREGMGASPATESQESTEGRRSYKCNDCGYPLVDSKGQPHDCIFPPGSMLFMGTGDVHMVATPAEEPAEEENRPEPASNDSEEEDLDRKLPAK
jgi:hypothetical protein